MVELSRIWLLLLVSLIGVSAIGAPNVSFERLPTKDSSKSNIGEIRGVITDSRGFIWITTAERLLRYDGTHYREYTDSPADVRGICTSGVNAQYTDYQGTLWTASASGLCRYVPERDLYEIVELHFAEDNRPPTPYLTTLQEDDHYLYIGTRGGIIALSPDKTRADFYPLPDQANPRDQPIEITSSFKDSKKRIWLATQAGLYRFDYQQHRFQKISIGTTDYYNKGTIRTFAEDIDGSLWVGYEQKGVIIIDPEKDSAHNILYDIPELKSSSIWGISIDFEGKVWIASSESGLGYFNRETKTLERIKSQENNPFSLYSDKVHALYLDKAHNLWVSTYPEGLQVLFQKIRSTENYRHLATDPNHSLNDNSVLSIFEEPNGNILVGTESGLNRFLPKTREFENLSDKKRTPHLPDRPITTINRDSTGDYWIGTWGDGFYRVNFEKSTFTHFEQSDRPNQLNAKIVWNFLFDGDKGVWIATEGGGLNYFDKATEKFSAFSPIPGNNKSISYSHVYAMLKDPQGNYWVATKGGLDYYTPATNEFHHFSSDTLDNKFISSKKIRALMFDKYQRLWVATEDKGIFIRDKNSGNFQRLFKVNGLPDHCVTALIDAGDGIIWAATLQGVAKINVDTLTIETINQNRGLIASSINRGALILSRNKYAYIGGTEGLSRYEITNTETAFESFPVKITRLRIANEIVSAQTRNPYLIKDISETQYLTLHASDHMFSFDFSALSYHLSSWNKYAYILEGFDTKCNQIGTATSATFTNIPAGDYKFRVKATNSDQQWSEQVAELNIRVLPPVWRTTWAYIFYLMMIVFVATLIYRYNITRIQHAKEKEVNNELIRLNQIKDAFLANTSHELRTPVNGMVGIAEALELESEQATPSQLEKISLIISSGKRLSSLINDILDYAKMADRDIVLHKSLININTMVKQVFHITAVLTKNKKIELVNRVSPSACCLYADANRIEQVLLNLVSNAIKYSDGGSVKIITDLVDDEFFLIVQDSGIGIAPEDIAKLFTPFSQLEASGSHRAGGTGLGLTVTKHLIECHKGKISVESTLGVGSRFIIAIPYAETRVQRELAGDNECSDTHDAHQEEHRFAFNNAQNSVTNTANATDIPQKNQQESTDNSSQISVLVADDNPINCMILEQQLKRGGYHVVVVNDGQEACDKFVQTPAIRFVILDVHMPKLGGFEAAEIIRASHQGHQIPLLFLSATITDEDNRATAAFEGAAIALKPIDKKQLLATVENLLKSATV